MNAEKLNTQLYLKMRNEQELYKAQILSMTPQDILDHAYEFVCREDILLSFEYNDLSSRQAAALLKSPTPLADVFRKWDSWKNGQYMSNIWNTVEARANEVVRAELIEAMRDSR